MSAAQVPLRQRAARHPLTKIILHPGVTLTALLILFALILFGTLYQTDHGLYEAQREFFGYGIVRIGGFFPLPAASLVLWVLTAQLMVTIAFILPWKPAKAGLWVAHVGILILMVGGFLTQIMAVESQLTLAEGEIGHFTTAYHEYELAFWEKRGDSNQVFAYDARYLKTDRILEVTPYHARVKVRLYYGNCEAFTAPSGGGPKYLTASGIGFIEQRQPDKEVTRNSPGLIFTFMEAGKPNREVLLYGLEERPLLLPVDGKKVFCQLRLKHYPLGFSLKLTDFVKNVHPGTNIPSSFESYAELRDGASIRPVKVWMNNPLRYGGYTFFQASYSQPPGLSEISTFAVVTNPGRILPYISSLTVFAGLLLYFLTKLTAFTRRETK